MIGRNEMTDVVGVKFKEVGKMYYFSPGEEEVRLGDEVIGPRVRDDMQRAHKRR